MLINEARAGQTLAVTLATGDTFGVTVVRAFHGPKISIVDVQFADGSEGLLYLTIGVRLARMGWVRSFDVSTIVCVNKGEVAA